MDTEQTICDFLAYLVGLMKDGPLLINSLSVTILSSLNIKLLNRNQTSLQN